MKRGFNRLALVVAVGFGLAAAFNGLGYIASSRSKLYVRTDAGLLAIEDKDSLPQLSYDIESKYGKPSQFDLALEKYPYQTAIETARHEKGLSVSDALGLVEILVVIGATITGVLLVTSWLVRGFMSD